MKKSINLLWIFVVVISSVTIVLSSFGCVEGDLDYYFSAVSPAEFVEWGFIDIIAIPTFIFVIAVYVNKRILSVISSILMFVQASLVSVIVPFKNYYYEHFELLGGLTKKYDYSITFLGVQVCILCWLLAAFSVLIVIRSGKTELETVTTSTKSGKILARILTPLFALVSTPILVMLIYMCKDLSPFLSVIVLLHMAVIFWVYVHPVVLLSKTGNKKYAFMLIGAILFFIMIMFKDKIIEFWYDLFPIICC